MKQIYKIFPIMVVLLFAGCSDLYDEINTSPNDNHTADVDELFTYSVVKGVSSYLSDVYLQQWGISAWMMHLAPMGGLEEGKEYLMPTGKDDFWSEQYTIGLKNSKEVIELTKNNSELINKNAIATIWNSFLFLRLTDLWGAIPYSEALKGIDELILMPGYDSQENIYLAIFDNLKKATESLDESKISFAAADPIYQGNTESWERFANSIQLRMAMRIKEVAPELAEQKVRELENLPLIEDNEQSALFPYNWDFKNPLGEIFESRQDNGKNHPSKFFVDYLKQTNDPRIGIYAEPTPFSQIIFVYDYVGIPNLVPASNNEIWDIYTDTLNISFIGEHFTNVINPGILLTNAEVNFLKAEAAIEGWITGSAQDYLEAGIRSECYRLDSTITDQQINTFVEGLPEVDLELIIQQKWVSFAYNNSYEAFADYRRTGYPILTNYEGNPVDAELIPNRLTYPNSEVSLNYDNYLKAIEMQGPDAPETRLWWDKN